MFGSSSGQVFSHFFSQFWLNLDTFMEKNIFGLVKIFLWVARVHKWMAWVELAKMALGWVKSQIGFWSDPSLMLQSLRNHLNISCKIWKWLDRSLNRHQLNLSLIRRYGFPWDPFKLNQNTITNILHTTLNATYELDHLILIHDFFTAYLWALIIKF